MTKIKLISLFVIFSLLLIACSVPIETSTPEPDTPVTENNDPNEELVATEPTDEPDIEEITPTEEADEETEVATEVVPEESTEDAPDADPTDEPEPTLEPPAWASFELTGKLIFTSFTTNNDQAIMRLDLVTGEIENLFVGEENSILNDVAVSPDGSQIIFAYAPPPEGGEVQLGFADLYIMPSDGSAEPTQLTEREDPSETYFNISWPVEEYIYFAHFSPGVGELGERIFASRVERLSYPDGEIEVLVEEATWPRLSHDGSQMAYVADTGEFFLANADGSDPEILIDLEAFTAVDSPLFSKDGEWLYFSAVPPENGLSFWDRLFGVKVASAHAVPSDWWRLRLDGSGDMEQLTNIFEIGLFGDIVEEDRYIAFITTNGVQIMNPDGTGVFRLLSIPATGTLSWVP